jgi:ribosome-binding protein aMBF1 (putative translation factor)
MPAQTLRIKGEEFVLLKKQDYEELLREREDALPPLPAPDEQGNYPASLAARAVLARGIVRDRVAAGLSRAELAKRARLRVTTLAKMESGESPGTASAIRRIDSALQQALRERKGKSAR